jgi:hypothetical protein
MARRIAAIEVRRHHPSRVSAGVCRADSALAVGGGSKFAIHTFRGSFGGGDHSGFGAIVGLYDPAEYVAFAVTHLANHDVPELAGSKPEQERIVSVACRHVGSLLATGTEYRRFLAEKGHCGSHAYHGAPSLEGVPFRESGQAYSHRRLSSGSNCGVPHFSRSLREVGIFADTLPTLRGAFAATPEERRAVPQAFPQSHCDI